DKSARIWNAVSGEAIGRPLRHKDVVRQASFSRDGLRVLTRTDHDVRVWDVSTGEPISPSFKQGGLLDAAFAPDDISVVAVGQDGASRWWELPDETRPVEELRKLAQLLSGQRFGSDGDKPQGLSPCSAQFLTGIWESLRSKYPEGFFRCSPEMLMSWHRQAAHDAENTRQWKLARLHLDALLASDPGHGELHRRRGYAYSEMSQWKEAIVDYTQALATKPDAE